MKEAPDTSSTARVLDGRDVASAVAAATVMLEAKEPVALATDTVYGLVARADDPGAVARLFELKARPPQRQIAVLVADVVQAETLVRLSVRARRLAEHYWPGPLTLVADRVPTAPAHLGDGTTIGVRCPDDDIGRALAALGALAATSANRHGSDTPTTAAEVARHLPEVDLVIDGGRRHGAASTVVDVSGAVPVVLRPGPVTAAEITAAWTAWTEP